MPSDEDSNHQPCKEWCASSDGCYGFTVAPGHQSCNFKASGCENDTYSVVDVTLYVKRLS